MGVVIAEVKFTFFISKVYSVFMMSEKAVQVFMRHGTIEEYRKHDNAENLLS